MDKPAIKYTESRSIPKAIKLFVLWRDGPLCVCGCGEVGKEFDHCPPWNLLEPKRHDPDKIFLKAKNCHREKSKDDTTNAAKVKRLVKKRTEERKPGSIKSRGFDKTLTKGFDGKVRRRK